MTDLQGGVSITTQNLAPAGAATAGSAVALDKINNAASLLVQVSGTFTGALSVQGRIDRGNWVTLGTIASASTGLFRANIAGLEEVRVTALAAVTGTAVVTLRTSIARGEIALAAPLSSASAATSNSEFRTTALTNVAQAVKASAGNLYGVNLVNVNTVPIYVKFYDKAAAGVVVGTDVPVLVITVPAGDGTTPGIVILSGSFSRKAFATAIAVAAVTSLADAGATAPTTSIYAEASYK